MTNNNPRIIRLAPKTQCYLDVRYDGHHSKFDVVDQRFDYPAIVPVTFPAACGYWPFNDNLLDVSGNNRNLSATGTISYDAGILANALKYADDNNYVSITGQSLDLSGSWTISYWIKWHCTDLNQTWSCIPIKFKYNTYSDIEIGHTIYEGTMYDLYVNTPSIELYHEFATALNPDVRHLFVVEYDGSALTVYLDNAQLATLSGASGLTNIDSIFVGNSDGNFDATLDTLIDELAIFPVALTLEQRSQLYNGGAGWSPY